MVPVPRPMNATRQGVVGGQSVSYTWPTGPVPQQLHLDLTVAAPADLDAQHERALALGARLLLDRSGDPEEPLRVYADPAGHPFCIFVAAGPVSQAQQLPVELRQRTRVGAVEDHLPELGESPLRCHLHLP